MASDEEDAGFPWTLLLSWAASGAMIFGGVIPYIPQYRDIKRTSNAEGFSLYVCLTLLIANTLRIIFWFGRPFEIPLLLQSMFMNCAMLAMVHLCVEVRRKSVIVPGRSHGISDFDGRYFWNWTDFLSYLEFMTTFSVVAGLIMYIFLDYPFFVESIGFLAVFTEAMLGVPQFHRNFKSKSTFGMSKKMVLLWTVGDVFKTTYFILKMAPFQFWVCGTLQIAIDVAILMQIFVYSDAPVSKRIIKIGDDKSQL